MSNLDPQTPNLRSQENNNVPSSADWRNVTMNEQSTSQNSELAVSFSTGEPDSLFRSTTFAPSPTTGEPTCPENEKPLSRLDTSSSPQPRDRQRSTPSPSSAGLRVQTDIIPGYTVTAASTTNMARGPSDSTRIPPKTTSSTLARAPSVKSVFASSVGSSSNIGSAPNSAFSSPMLNAMGDVTPLPSPLMTGDSPGPWKKITARPSSRDMMVPNTSDSALVTTNGESVSAAIANQSKRRAYHGLSESIGSGPNTIQSTKDMNAEGHARNRSVSEYMPENAPLPKSRHITVSGSHATVLDVTSEPLADVHMRREPHLAVQRGLAPVPKPPTPPSSRTGGESSDSESSLSTDFSRSHKKPRYETYDAYTREDSKRRRWRALKILGEGTFSKVMLATSQVPDSEDRVDEDDMFGSQMDGIMTPAPDTKIDRKKLVAVKICEHGPKGGASEERVEMSLKRELEIMKSIHHPSLVHLKAWNIEETRAILVLSYCPGGDLFEVASEHRDLLVPGLLRRIFSELVAAVQYLHDRHIVHRDIKLENVLVNLPPHELQRPQDWAQYPYSIITLTDLGLSRRVADDEKLSTRCGSDDYAAPEVIMGQPYDGRATDAWSLGVLLYALLESRLPFDPNPGMSEGHKQRSRTSHRIARVEWRWIEYAGDEGDHEGDPEKFKERGLLGAMNVTEGLLKRARSRWTMAKVAAEEWVKGGIDLDNGIRFREEDIPEEVSDNGAGGPSPL